MKLSSRKPMRNTTGKQNSVPVFLIALIIVFQFTTAVATTESGKSSLSGPIQHTTTSTTILEKGEAIGTANFSDSKITFELSQDNKSIEKVVVFFDSINVNIIRKEQGVKVTQNSKIKGSSYYFNGPFSITNDNFTFLQGGTTCSGSFSSLKEAAGTIHLVVDIMINNGTISVDFGNLKWEAKR